MIRGFFIFVLMALAMALPASAEGFYARGGVGLTNGDKLSAFGTNPTDLLRGKTGTSALYEVGLGKAIPIPLFGLRTEITFAYRPNFKLDGAGTVGGKPANAMVGLNQHTGMANVYFEAPGTFILHPFLGAGAGAARNDASSSNTDFAWNIMAGFTVQLLPMTNLDFTLRHLDAGEVTGTLNPLSPPSMLTLHSQMRTNEGVIGVRISF